MLVQIVIVESGDRRLKDVGRGGGAGRHSPAPIPEEQCGLCLGSGEAELAGEGLAEPGSRIFPKFPKALRDVVFAEPYDTTRASEDAVYLLRWRKPHRTSAVLADRSAEKGEGRRRHVEMPSPPGHDGVAVGKKPPQPWTDDVVGMRSNLDWH